MCRDVDAKSAREPSLSETVQEHGERLEVHRRRLEETVEDLYAIANRVGMTLPSAAVPASVNAAEPSYRG